MLDSVTPQIIVHQAPLSMKLARLKYWSGFPYPPLGNLPDPGVKCISLISPIVTSGFFSTTATWEALVLAYESQLASPPKSAFSDIHLMAGNLFNENIYIVEISKCYKSECLCF